ncbi:Adenylate cyclase [compost metagenome]
MTSIHEIRPEIDDGIDRKALAQLRRRFLTINRGRLERTMEGLSSRQRLVLRLLPLLLDVNHPLLPGYVSAATPAGLCGFAPDDELLGEAQRLTRSFSYKPRRNAAPPIHGLFLMGSPGSVAQAECSDLDLWVCHSPDLDGAALAELRRKCGLLERWAHGQGSEMHCFLVDAQRFLRGEREARLSSEDCGSSQHYLLLDEFYRTAIWLGGRTPLWWLVPPEAEGRYGEYVDTLLRKRFVDADEVLDFGHLARIPPGEFIGAGMWQLFKGIDSPYKSALKLLLCEVYASQHPQVECLSLRFKTAVYAGRLELDELDPYLMLYRRLEEYLTAAGDRERLELVRRCLYLKTGKKLSRPPRLGRKSWQRQLMERLVGEWGWDARTLVLLDERERWKVRQVLQERRTLVNELTYSYRFLSRFARQQQAVSEMNRRDLQVLGRRLYAAFERKAGKVEAVNPGIAPDLGEAVVTLARQPGGEAGAAASWALYGGGLTATELDSHAPLKRTHGLVELLAWGHRNGVIDSATRCSLHPGDSALREAELGGLLASLQQAFPLPLADVPEQHLLRASVPTRCLLLVDVGLDQPAEAERDNPVLSLDLVSLNSWNELLVSRHAGPGALPDCLRDHLNALPAGASPPRLLVRCFRAAASARRVEELFTEVTARYASGERGRYLLQSGQRFHLLHLQPGAVEHRLADSRSALLEQLGEGRGEFSPLHLDRHALDGEDLALILPLGQAGCIQVFYRLDNGHAELTVLDERNSLWRQRQPCDDENGLLVSLQRFLQAVHFRRSAQLPLVDGQVLPAPAIRYYRLLPDGRQRALRVEPREVPQKMETRPYFNIQAIVEPGQGRRQITLYCDHQEFSELEYGGRLFHAVARHILARRHGRTRYPCYITDLDLSALKDDGRLQTLHYLRCKQSLEGALNRALAEA